MFEHIKHGDEEHQRWLLNAIDNFFPLYTAQPAPDPLSDEEIKKLWTNQAPQNEFECVRLVEKAHGIGV